MPISVKSIVMVRRFEVRQSKRGENYAALSVNLGKPGGFASRDAKIWQFDRFTHNGRPAPEEGALIEATYKVEEFRGMPQLNIEDYRPIEGEEREKAIEAFVPPTEIDTAFYRRRLEELMDQIEPGRVSGTVALEVFDRADFRESFFTGPAAASRHQHYPGGLLEHTINVTSLALALADAYGAEGGLSVRGRRPPVDRTLLISAGLLHDIGKLETYQLAPMSERTDADSFQGHLSIGYARVHALVEPLKKNPPYAGAVDELDKLLNCILSHHGLLEYGSPVMPCCLEAVFLSQADSADSRVSAAVHEGFELLAQNPHARWLRHSHFPAGVFVADWPRESRKDDSTQ
jgi:3'-5' exoribonuclease